MTRILHMNRATEWSYLPIGESSSFAKEYKIFEQENLTQAFFTLSLPD